MSQKNHLPGPVPAGNRPHAGSAEAAPGPNGNEQPGDQHGTGFQEQDPKRRLGNYTGAGEASRQQPGPRNDGGERHGEDAG